MVVNINDEIAVRLTEAGERAWFKYWEEVSPLGVPKSIRKGATLEDGRVRFQIWSAMNIFGPDCFNGSNHLPFVNNEIEIDKRGAL